jgi:hypothetical protein
MVSSRLQEISLTRIDWDETAWEEAPAPVRERLTASLQEVGLLNPPWLRPREAEPNDKPRFQVVTGTRRLAAAARLGWREISARVAPADTPDLSCLLVHLGDNAFGREFNLKEQAGLARRLLQYCPPETVASRYLPYLGLPPSGAHLERLVKAAGLEAPWQGLAARGRLALTAAARLADWEAADRAAAWPYLHGLSLSQSKQEELLGHIELLARRQGVAPAIILAREELHRALTDPRRTPQERTATVRQHLNRWVYPRLSAAREAFAAALGRLGWPGHPRLRLQPPPAFEGPDYSLHINFRDAAELERLLDEAGRLARQEEFARLTRS